MSGERFFDDLARTLAEPMPRRRAVRVLGVSLAVSLVPGVGPRLARAASGSTAQVTCRGDRRTCQKGAEENFEKYCCASPSWQWFCGGQDNGYTCINTCPRGAKTFPCTALVAHPESGINGVCCDRRIHSGCVPIGPPREKRPDGSFVPSQEWKPSCCPKGPGFGFCNDVCCQAPNRCKNGKCRCPNGADSCDGRKCCRTGDACAECESWGTEFFPRDPNGIDLHVVRRKCCPKGLPHCCGTTCCKHRGCCGTTCCRYPDSQCTRSGGKTVCCPRARATVARGHWSCCPAGTEAVPGGGCCPPNDPTCCGGLGVPAVNCGAKLCVRGACVNP